MNTTEHIVESYFRLCRGCFTMADMKVVNGNNRQIDLLAYNLKTSDQFHVEVAVTHQVKWCPSLPELIPEFEKKFFGKPAERAGPNTDHAKGKSYFDRILETYRLCGFDPDKVQRFWVCWVLNGAEDMGKALADYGERKGLKKPIRILSFRDVVLPELQEAVATSNYDDEVLRTLSLLKQQQTQAGSCGPEV